MQIYAYLGKTGMETWKDRLDHLEDRLRRLIEGGSARLFPWRDGRDEVASRLLEAMREGIRVDQSGNLIAPNLYTISTHPEHVHNLRASTEWLENLASLLKEESTAAGLYFLSPPVIRVISDKKLPPRVLNVHAQISQEELAQTTDLPREGAAIRHSIPTNAYLIVDGTRFYPLNRLVINIGRRPDNQLVISDSRVSRVHAQLRVLEGRFYIFDLDSTGGTFVNNQRIHRAALSPGDVISLAGYPLVYAHDEEDLVETQKLGEE